MYVQLKDISTKANRLGEYGTFSGAYEDMITICSISWGIPRTSIMVKRNWEEESNKYEDVFTVYADHKRRKFSIEIRA